MKDKSTCLEDEDEEQNSFPSVPFQKGKNRNTKINSFEISKNSNSKLDFCLLFSIILLIALAGIAAYRYLQFSYIQSQISPPILSQNNQIVQPPIIVNVVIKSQKIQEKHEQMIRTQATDEQQLLRAHLKRFKQQNPYHISFSQQQYLKQKQQSIQKYKDSQQLNLLTKIPIQQKVIQQQKQTDDEKTSFSDSSYNNIPGIKQIQQISDENEQDEKNEVKHQYSQNQLYDPIMKVREKIGYNFQTTFQDTPFIKKGTGVTQNQYNKAKQRMNLWKYFNILTKQFQFIQNGRFQHEQPLNPQILDKMKVISQVEKLQIQQQYHVSQYDEIGFCLIIPSYKNNDKYFRNLNSIFQQNYSNFHVIYIDDASKDGTAQSVKDYIKKYQIPSEKLKFIQNQQNKKALPNIDYAARSLCKSGQIMAIIDGDDYLIGRQVFKIINSRYQSKNLLSLYTNHLRVHEPIYLKVGTCIDYPAKIKKMRGYRHFDIFPASHLRTFYVDLYWKIRRKDLRDLKGQYFQAANDFAIMMPILQMSGQRFQYLPELTYIYDAGTGYNNFQTKSDVQATNFKITKRRHKYPKLGKDLGFVKSKKSGIQNPLKDEPIQNPQKDQKDQKDNDDQYKDPIQQMEQTQQNQQP